MGQQTLRGTMASASARRVLEQSTGPAQRFLEPVYDSLAADLCWVMPTGDVPDWWREEEAFDAMLDEQFFSELDAHIAAIHEWLEVNYRCHYKPGQVELCLEAALACQEEKVPIPPWLIEALRTEIELALKRPVAWEQLRLAARDANNQRKADAEQAREWFLGQAHELLERNPGLNSESRLAELIAARAEGTEHEADPRTIRRHISGILAKRSKRGQN